MNRVGRSRVREILERLQEIGGVLEELSSDEEDAIGGLSEYFPDHPNIERMEEIRDSLEDASSGVNEAVEQLEGVLE